MKKGDYLSAILRSRKTVFTTVDIALLWHESNTNAARVRLHYYVKQGELYRIRHGLYAKDKNYNRWELATRILTPAYVSFETVLAREGMVFQYYQALFIASYTTRRMVIDDQEYYFRKVKDVLLTDSTGIQHIDETSIATRERAFLDMLYVTADFHFDNLRSLDWERVHQILPIYRNQRLVKKVNDLYQKVKSMTP